MVTPGKEHWTIVKRVFRYLHGIIYFAICYHGNYEEVGVYGFIISSWDGEVDGSWSTNGYVFILFRGVVS